ncbi:MAG: hypothetical protein AAFY76_23675 [Cyanobacteria bacterium J06649_11]
MSIKVKGTVERRDIGMGAWAFIGEDGKTYEIMRGVDKSLLQSGQRAEVTGNIREDVMTTAMIGPVLEVESFNINN